ncbi:inositol-3-phosphate synthase [Desulfurococcaceae archaeon AG1]|nr:MAG: inositol-3-phosphate synthase [Desulfurococcaceae archaeon]GAY25101.1 inositol-3-phosphate synthase [Desulfurococcaceae archaeon AG1]
MIRVAIVGVGNIASMLVQSVYMYKARGSIEGVMTENIGGYRVGDIDFVAAFDISRRKVGKDLGEAIYEPPNSVPRIFDVRRTGVTVSPGPVLDGVAPHMRSVFEPIETNIGLGDIVDILRSSKADVVVNLLPVGSEEASRLYARASLEAGAAFINAIPVFIASDPSNTWQKLYREAGVPLLGDDIKGQVGATILHRTLIKLLHMRGVLIDETYQLNVGGNTDFLNMVDEERLYSKRISKTRAVTSILPYGDKLENEGRVRIGPSDYIPFLNNTKIAYIYIKGRSFGGLPVTLEAKLSVDDKSMAAAVLLDAIRVAKLALDRGHGGPIRGPSAYLFKHPPIQAPDDETAYRWFLEYVEKGIDINDAR